VNRHSASAGWAVRDSFDYWIGNLAQKQAAKLERLLLL
jgi:hypothetical protein